MAENTTEVSQQVSLQKRMLTIGTQVNGVLEGNGSNGVTFEPMGYIVRTAPYYLDLTLGKSPRGETSTNGLRQPKLVIKTEPDQQPEVFLITPTGQHDLTEEYLKYLTEQERLIVETLISLAEQTPKHVQKILDKSPKS